jgi:hypothetical protein
MVQDVDKTIEIHHHFLRKSLTGLDELGDKHPLGCAGLMG